MRSSVAMAMQNKVLMSLVLVFVTCAVYWQVVGHQFVNFDDGKYIFENPHVLTGLTGEGVIWAFTSTYASNWHPLTWLSHMLDVQLFGLDPGPHHAVNVLIHAITTVLLFLLLLRMTGEYWQSAVVAALFALHPLHVESVAWAAERKDVLSAFFWMLTLLLYARYAESPGRGRYLLTLGAFALGLMAKPMLVTLPFVLLLLDYWPFGRFQLGQANLNPLWEKAPSGDREPLRRILWEKAPFLALAAASSIMTLYAQQKGGAVSSIQTVPIFFRLVNALWAYVRYLAEMVWPFDLAVLYPLPATLNVSQGLFAAAFLGIISVLVIRMAKQHPYFLFGWLWYLGTLVPVIGLVQVGSQSMADRYTYLPSIGIFIMLAWGMRIAAGDNRFRRTVASAVAIVLLVACATISWIQLGYWKNSLTLFGHASEVIPGNYIAHEALGFVLAESNRLDEAVSQYSESLRIWPDYERAVVGLGNVLVRQGRMEEAALYANRALRLKPGSPEAHFLLGFVRMKQGKNEEALYHYSEGLRSDPENAEIHHIVGVILGTQGKLEESVEHFKEALRIKPDYAEGHYGLGVALLRQGKVEESMLHFEEALRIRPDFPEARSSLNEAMHLKKTRKEG